MARDLIWETYAKDNPALRDLPPMSKVMRLEAARDHLGVHIAAQAELQAHTSPADDSLAHRLTHVNHMANPIRAPAQ